MMKTMAAAAAALTAATAIAPAIAAPERKTEMLDQGKSVDSLLLRYGFEATWVIDPQSILLRDTYRDHYVVTTESPCEWLELDRAFSFFPRLTDRVRASLSYEVRDYQHEDCRIAKIEKVSKDTARELRAKVADKE